MLESLSQVGTNCHKVQNVLVSWGVCSLLSMPQPPWGKGKGSRSPYMRTQEGWGQFFVFLSRTQTHAHCTLHKHTCILLPRKSVTSIMFRSIHFLNF